MSLLKWLGRGRGEGSLPALPDWDFWVDLADEVRPASELTTGLLFMGTPRSGKTSLIEGILRSFVRNGRPVISVDFEGGQAHRLQEVAPPGYRVHRIDVTVKGGAAVDIRPLLGTQIDIDRFAGRMSPPEGHQNDFFNNAVALVLRASAMMGMRLAPNDFTLADNVRLAKDRYLLSELGRKFTDIGDPWELFSNRKGSGADVYATLMVKLWPLESYSALALQAETEVDVLSLARGTATGAVVFVFKDTHKHALEKFLSFVLDCAMYEKLSRPGSGLMAFNCDEVTSLAKLDSLVDINRRGSKTRLVTMVSAQSAEGIESRYDKEAADILALPAWKFFLRQASKKSAQWASDMLGECEVLDNIPPRPYDGRPPRPGAEITGNIRNRPNVTWDELRRLPLAYWGNDGKDDDRVWGYVDSPYGPRGFAAPFRDLVETKTPPPVYEDAHPGLQQLPPFTKEDIERLNIPMGCVLNAEARREADRKRADKGKGDD